MEKIQINQLIQIETTRLIFRPICLGGEYQLNQAICRSSTVLQRWMPWAIDTSFASTKEFVFEAYNKWQEGVGPDFPMVVVLKETGQIIAASGFNERSDLSKPFFEIGYWIDSQYEGREYVSEYVNGLTRYALNALKAQRVQIICQHNNIKSQAVAKRLAYQKEAVLKNHSKNFVTNEVMDTVLFSLTAAP